MNGKQNVQLLGYATLLIPSRKYATIDSMDRTLKYDHSFESCWAVLCQCYPFCNFGKLTKFGLGAVRRERVKPLPFCNFLGEGYNRETVHCDPTGHRLRSHVRVRTSSHVTWVAVTSTPAVSPVRCVPSSFVKCFRGSMFLTTNEPYRFLGDNSCISWRKKQLVDVFEVTGSCYG